MRKLFLDGCEGRSYQEVEEIVVKEFEITKEEISRYDIIVAALSSGGYDGSAYFLIKEHSTGNLLEVIAGHCSCYGFEGQWVPKISSREYLLSEHYRPESDYETSSNEIKKFVKELFN